MRTTAIIMTLCVGIVACKSKDKSKADPAQKVQTEDLGKREAKPPTPTAAPVTYADAALFQLGEDGLFGFETGKNVIGEELASLQKRFAKYLKGETTPQDTVLMLSFPAVSESRRAPLVSIGIEDGVGAKLTVNFREDMNDEAGRKAILAALTTKFGAGTEKYGYLNFIKDGAKYKVKQQGAELTLWRSKAE